MPKLSSKSAPKQKAFPVKEVRADPVEESREDPGLLDAILNPLSWFPAVETDLDAVSSTDEIQSIIDAHVDEETRARCLTSRISAQNQDVKGSHSTLANEIKKLGKLERKKEKLVETILKCEHEISIAEKEQEKTKERIKALSYKFELHGMVDDRTGSHEDEDSIYTDSS